MKLIIDIPDNEYKYTCERTLHDRSIWDDAIRNGTPLDDVKAEIKAMFPPSGNWMYDEECEHEHTVCEVLSGVLQILDNIGKAESEE